MIRVESDGSVTGGVALGAHEAGWERRSAVRVVPAARPRKLAKVPFVELADGRLQGVVSSGSDVSRVYVSSFTAGSHAFDCRTNNTRPCGGLRGAPCKHLRSLADEAVLQYGTERVARYLKADVEEGGDLVGALDGSHEPADAAVVFSRFLRHLSYLEMPGTTEPVPELHWFAAGVR
jgi:hypothetical protein